MIYKQFFNSQCIAKYIERVAYIAAVLGSFSRVAHRHLVVIKGVPPASAPPKGTTRSSRAVSVSLLGYHRPTAEESGPETFVSH